MNKTNQTTVNKLSKSLNDYKSHKLERVHRFADTLPSPRTEIEAILQASIVAGDTKNIRYCVTCDMYHRDGSEA